MNGPTPARSAASGNGAIAESEAQIIRVLHLSATNFFGGPEKQIIGHALAVNRHRYAVSVAAFSERGRETELVRRARDSGLTGWTIPVRSAYDPRAPRRIARLLADGRFEILVTHNYRSHLLGRRAAQTRRIKHIAVSRGWTSENLKVRLYHWLDKKTLRKSDLIVCVSQNKSAELREAGVPGGKLAVIPNAVNTDVDEQPAVDWRKKFGWPADSQLVVSAGRLSSEKGPDLFITTIGALRDSFPRARFIIFGDGPLAGSLARRIQEEQLDEIVRLAGHVAHLERELSAFELLVNPSRLEGLPNIVLEAMAARLPVVATAVGGVSELISAGQTGWLVPPQPEALTRAIDEVLTDPAQAARRAEQARELVRGKYSFAAQARLYEKIYHQLITERRPVE